MDLEPGEHCEIGVELPLPLSKIDKLEFEIEWDCPSCEHTHLKKIRPNPAEKIVIRFWCPCCTPWHIRFFNFFTQN